MQTTQIIYSHQLRNIVEAAFSQGDVVVKQTYSDYDAFIRQFYTSNDLLEDLALTNEVQTKTYAYSMYYPEANGHVFEKRISLIPEKCGGHTFRYSVEGWGWIHLRCDYRNHPRIKCNVSVNSPERAHNWYDTYPEYKNPDLWDWDILKKWAGKLIRLLRKYGKEAEPFAAPDAAPPRRRA